MSIEKKIVRRLSDAQRDTFFRRLYNENFEVIKKDHMKDIYEIRTMPLVRREGYYVPCAYLNGDTLELVNFNIEEFRKGEVQNKVGEIYREISGKK